MEKITQPIQGRRAKPGSSAFFKPPLKRSIAVIGTSGLVFGLGIAGGSPASAENPLCIPDQIVVPVSDPLDQAAAIESEMADGLVCLNGHFEIHHGIFFQDPVTIIGLENTSITTADHLTNAVFENSTYGDASIEIENVDIYSTGQVVRGYDVQIKESVFVKTGEVVTDNGGAIFSFGNVTIADSTLSNYDAGAGGAIFSLGNVTIMDSILSNNSAYAEGGGAIASILGSVTVQNSTLSDNTANALGGAIYAGGIGTISNSTLSGNSAGVDGGAIYAEGEPGTTTGISNSTLSNNSADGDGGAIYGFGITLSVTKSTFLDNSASNGGAMYSQNFGPNGGGVAATNSTFVENIATDVAGEGGAIFAYSGEILFSTFVNNLASAPAPDQDTPGNAIYKTGDGLFEIGANIFSGASADPQLGVGAVAPTGFSDMGGNVFSTLEITEEAEIQVISVSTQFEKSLSLIFGTSSPFLATYAPNSSGTQTIGLAAGSPALGIVLDSAPFDRSALALDQRGAARAFPADAGAFQGVVAAPPQSGQGPADFTVFSIPSGITKPGAGVKVDGANLNLVKEVYVNGVKVKIKEQSAASLVFTAPRGLIGVVDVRFVSAASQYTAFRALDFGSSAASSSNARTVVGGFAANSTRLSVKMKREIRAFLKSNPGYSTVTCMGFTSEPATAMDSALAKARGQVTCNFVKKIDSGLKAKVVQGRHTEQPGSKIRRVRITLE